MGDWTGTVPSFAAGAKLRGVDMQTLATQPGADLQPGPQVQLFRLVEFLKRNPDRKALIEGHTDSIGSSEYNLQRSRPGWWCRSCG